MLFNYGEIHLDHLVYGVADLSKCIVEIKSSWGVEPIIGGKHEQYGTHNALLKLGKNVYLEFLALDPEAKPTKPLPSWSAPLKEMTRPKIITWVLQCNNINKIVDIYNSAKKKSFHIDPSNTMSRKKPDGSILEWKIACNQKPPAPADGAIPFLIDWGKSYHPTNDLKSGCELKNLDILSPESNGINKIFKKINIPIKTKQSDLTSIKALIQTPNGEFFI